MKRIICVFLSLCFFISLFGTNCISAIADDNNGDKCDYDESIYVKGQTLVSKDGKYNYFIGEDDKIYIDSLNFNGTFKMVDTVDGFHIDSYSNFKLNDNFSKIIIPKKCEKYLENEEVRFSGLKKIKTVVIEEGIEYIPDFLFNCDENINKIYFPSTLKRIGLAAFYGIGDAKIYFNGTEKQYNKIKSDGCNHIHQYVVFNDNTVYNSSISGMTFGSYHSGKKSITLSAYDMNKSYTFEIQLSQDKNFKKNVKKFTVKNKKSFKKTFTGLKSKTKYYFRIKIYYKKKGITYYNYWSTLSEKTK